MAQLSTTSKPVKPTAGATDEAPEPEKKQSKGAIHYVKKRSSSLKKMLSSSKIEVPAAAE